MMQQQHLALAREILGQELLGRTVPRHGVRRLVDTARRWSAFDRSLWATPRTDFEHLTYSVALTLRRLAAHPLNELDAVEAVLHVLVHMPPMEASDAA